MPGTTYRRATSLDEACAVLAERGGEAKVLAGGQSLIPLLSLGLARPATLVDIGRIAGLDRLETGARVSVGALVRHRTFEQPDDAVRRLAPLMVAAAPWIGHPAIRNRGTVVGSVVHGDPAAEWPAVAVALDATIELVAAGRRRAVAARDFFEGPLTTAIREDEVATGLTLPAAPPRTGASVLELAYRHGDYAVVGVACQLTLAGEGERLAGARLALFGVGPTPIRADNAEAVALAGPSAFSEAARIAAGEARPSSDATASAGYRRRMVEVYVRRALAAALEAARAADA